MCSKFLAVGGVSAVLVSGILPTAQASDGFWKRSYQPDQPISKIDEAIKRFNRFDALASESSASIPDYIRSGIVLSDLACENWLGMLGQADRDASFAKDVLNVVGNLILGISGINGANPSSLARGSLAMAAGNASIDSFKNEVILGAISDIEAKLNEGRKITAATIKSYIPTTTNYDDAKGQLIAYHRDCSPNAIKNLLKTSLSAVKYEPADTTLSGEIAKAKASALVAKLSGEIYPDEKTKRLSDDELYKLYLAKIMQVGDSTFIASMFPNDTKELSDDFSSKNERERLDTLQDIAILKQFNNRYKSDKLAAQRKAENDERKATEQRAVAATAVAKAQKSLPAADAAKVANTPELREFFAHPQGQVLTPGVLDQLQERTSAIANRGSSSAKNLDQATKALVESTAREEKAKEVSAAVAAAPEPATGQTDAAKSSIAPVSVNAVLVPTK